MDSGSIFGLIKRMENAPGEATGLLHAATLLVALGSALLLMGLLGCCGVVRKSKCLLLTVGGSPGLSGAASLCLGGISKILRNKGKVHLKGFS